ncbi:MAG: hypothetical protein CMO74_10150 [Verrucomicrobiales bacterium]|nr:hypothetical protein [Verrucomicrobiales bacterium]|tara:strand:+ start:59335 stop:60591 length:1257 start_codon:yes stop_codon:yes gene_type:complete
MKPPDEASPVGPVRIQRIPRGHPLLRKRVLRACLLFIIFLCGLIIWVLLGPWAQRAEAHRAEMDKANKRIAQLDRKIIREQARRKNVEFVQAKIVTRDEKIEIRCKQQGVSPDVTARANAAVKNAQRQMQAQAFHFDQAKAQWVKQHQEDVATLQRQLALQQGELQQAQAVILEHRKKEKDCDEEKAAREAAMRRALAAAQSRVRQLEHQVGVRKGSERKAAEQARELKDAQKELAGERVLAARMTRQIQILRSANESLKKEIARMANRPEPKSMPDPKVAQQARDLAALRAELKTAEAEKENLLVQMAELTSRLARLEDAAAERNNSSRTTLPTIPAPQTNATGSTHKITRVHAQYGFAETDWRDARKGQVAWVWRDGLVVAKMEVLRITNGRAVLRFPSGAARARLQMGDVIRPGK